MFDEWAYCIVCDVFDDHFDANMANDLLVDKARPHGQLLLLKLEEVSDLCICRDWPAEKFRIFYATAVKVVVVRNDPHLVLDEYDREILVVTPPHAVEGMKLAKYASSSHNCWKVWKFTLFTIVNVIMSCFARTCSVMEISILKRVLAIVGCVRGSGW